MALTLGQMRERVRRALKDSSGKFVTDGQIDEWLNEAQLEIAVRTLGIQEEATGTLSAATLALPDDFLSVVFFSFGEDTVEWADNEVYNSWSTGGDTPFNTLARIHQGNIEFYPTPSAAAYTFRYARTPTLMNQDADVPEVMPQFHTDMIRYAQGWAKRQDGERDEGDDLLARFEQRLPATTGPSAEHKQGPRTVRWEYGPFETGDARHI